MSAAQGKTIVIDLDGRTARISGKDDLYQGDSYANDIVVEFVRSGAPAQISGYTASGEFERSDGVKVPCTGTLSGNVATIKLDEHCYYRDGVYRLTVRLSKSNEDITRTVLEITGTVQSRSDGPTVDIDETLVNVDKVLELYDEMKDATKNVQSATDAANDAAAAAQQATTQANTAANSANVAAGSVNSSISQAASAATNANNAAQTANTAAANADTQANSAADAAIRALAAAAKPPLVDPQSKTWRIWDDANQTYKATEYPAQGPKGDKGDKGDAAQVTAANIQNALGYVPADPDKVTISAEKIEEALGYTPANDASTEQIFSELDKLENNKLDNRGLPYNRVIATDSQGYVQYLTFDNVGGDITATKIQQALGYIPLKEITAEGIETALGYEPADKVATDSLFRDKLGLWNNTPNKYVVTDSAGSIRFADPPAGGGGGGGVPPTGPYQMLVTDGDQNQVWEERTHYPYTGLIEILPEVEYKNIEYEPGTISQNITAYMKGPIVAGKTYYITFGDERLECLAYVDGPGMTVIAENNDFINARVAVIYYSDGKCLLSVNDGDANPNPIVKVEGPGVKYKKIDPAKYLPEGGVGWTEEGESDVIVEMTWTEEMSEQMGGQMVVLTPPSMPLEDEVDYTFTINGAKYNATGESITMDGQTVVAAGNIPLLMENGDNGMPFVYVDTSTIPDMAAGGMYGLFVLLAEPTWPCTLQIHGDGAAIHGIDPKYLPEGGVGWTEKKQAFILPETTWEDDSYYYPGKLPHSMVEGQKYKVTLNGDEYNCVCRKMEALGMTMLCLGDYDATGTNHEPFRVWQFSDDAVAQTGNGAWIEIRDINLQGPYTMSIAGEAVTVHQIDDKYIPQNNFKTFYAASADIDTASHNVQVWIDSNRTRQLTYAEAIEILNNGGCLISDNGWRFPPAGWVPSVASNKIFYLSAFNPPGAGAELYQTTLLFADTISD